MSNCRNCGYPTGGYWFCCYDCCAAHECRNRMVSITELVNDARDQVAAKMVRNVFELHEYRWAMVKRETARLDNKLLKMQLLGLVAATPLVSDGDGITSRVS